MTALISSKYFYYHEITGMVRIQVLNKNLIITLVSFFAAFLPFQATTVKAHVRYTDASSSSINKPVLLQKRLLAQTSEVDRVINNYLSTADPLGGKIYEKLTAGVDPFTAANDDFDYIVAQFNSPITTYPGNIRSTRLPDGTTVGVRPTSSAPSYPTIQINRPTSSNPYKVRYRQAECCTP